MFSLFSPHKCSTRLLTICFGGTWLSHKSLIGLGSADGSGSPGRLFRDSNAYGLVIGLAVLSLIVILILMDVICYAKFSMGALYFLRNSLCQPTTAQDKHKAPGAPNGNMA